MPANVFGYTHSQSRRPDESIHKGLWPVGLLTFFVRRSPNPVFRFGVDALSCRHAISTCAMCSSMGTCLREASVLHGPSMHHRTNDIDPATNEIQIRPFQSH